MTPSFNISLKTSFPSNGATDIKKKFPTESIYFIPSFFSSPNINLNSFLTCAKLRLTWFLSCKLAIAPTCANLFKSKGGLTLSI